MNFKTVTLKKVERPVVSNVNILDDVSKALPLVSGPVAVAVDVPASTSTTDTPTEEAKPQRSILAEAKARKEANNDLPDIDADYSQRPIDGFGLSFLMSFASGKKIDPKKMDEPSNTPKLRPKNLGLGAKPISNYATFKAGDRVNIPRMDNGFATVASLDDDNVACYVKFENGTTKRISQHQMRVVTEKEYQAGLEEKHAQLNELNGITESLNEQNLQVRTEENDAFTNGRAIKKSSPNGYDEPQKTSRLRLDYDADAGSDGDRKRSRSRRKDDSGDDDYDRRRSHRSENRRRNHRRRSSDSDDDRDRSRRRQQDNDRRRRDRERRDSRSPDYAKSSSLKSKSRKHHRRDYD